MIKNYCRNIYVVCLLLSLVCCQKEENSIRVCFTGDLLLDRGIRAHIEKHEVASLFHEIEAVFERSDYVVANLECPVTKDSSPINKQFIFRAEPEWLEDLRKAGITHLIMANNHSNDQGRNGIITTADNIEKYGLTPVGYGNNQLNACKPVIIEKGSLRVAIFSSVFVPLENWMFLENSPGPCQATAEDMAQNIRNYKDENPNDMVVVVLHWGVEFQKTPTPDQRYMAKLITDAGADAIIGHHPHVIQSISFHGSKPVFYSLGNFVFDQKTPEACNSILVELEFYQDKEPEIIIHPVKINNCVPEIMTQKVELKKAIQTISSSFIWNDKGDYWTIKPE